MSTGYNTATPYIASYVVLKKNGKVAFVLRENTKWMNGHYGLPSGKVEKNEPYLLAAVREALEEVGAKINPKHLKHVLTVHRYEPSSFASDWVDTFFEASEWEGEPYNAEPHMHSKLDWLDPKNLPKNVIPSVKFALEQIEAGNSYAEYGWGSK